MPLVHPSHVAWLRTTVFLVHYTVTGMVHDLRSVFSESVRFLRVRSFMQYSILVCVIATTGSMHGDGMVSACLSSFLSSDHHKVHSCPTNV